MSANREHPGARRPMDPSLDAVLDARGDGDELRRVFESVPATDAHISGRERDAAWARLAARLHDSARAPYTDEVRAPIDLVRDTATTDTIAIDATGRDSAGRNAAARDATTPRPARSARPATRRWLAVAAALVVVAGSGWTWANSPVVHAVAVGSAPLHVTLADGSDAWIAPGSQVTMPRRFGWASPLAPAVRRLQLEGEAYFEVQRDGRRFEVDAGDIRVQVLGTRFAVRTAHDGVAARVDVSEGRVAVLAGASRAELAVGESVLLRDGGLLRRAVVSERVATWRTGGLAALDEPLGSVLVELARRYGVEIAIDEAVDPTPTVSLFYADAPSVEVVLGDLCTAQGLGFTKTSRGYRIVRP